MGVNTLLRLTKLADKPRLDAEDVAFTLAPRLNAAGRLEQALLAVELLVTDNAGRAEELAQYLDQLNSTRQSLERSILLAANKQVKEECDPAENAALVLANHGWHAGVIGIVAGKLAEKYHRPVVLISWDRLGIKPGVGSARSVPGFHLHTALAACGHHLPYGGHAAAAGLKIDEANFPAFRQEFCEYAQEQLGSHNGMGELVIDAEVPLSFTPQVIDQIEQMAPFGHGNSRPLLCTSGVSLAEPPRTMGEGGRPWRCGLPNLE